MLNHFLKALIAKKCSVFCVGATRSGTTFLWHTIRQNNALHVPTYKELNVFNGDDVQTKIHAVKALHSNFSYKNAIDFSPLYWEYGVAFKNRKISFNNENYAVSEILKYKPDARFILCLRDPRERLVSTFRKARSQGKITSSLKEEIQQEFNTGSSRLNLLWRNKYSLHINKFLETVPQKQRRIVYFENIARGSGFPELFDFMGASVANEISLPDHKFTNSAESLGSYQLTPSDQSFVKKEVFPTLVADLYKVAPSVRDELPKEWFIANA